MYIYIYIYRCISVSLSIYIYIYIFIHIYTGDDMRCHTSPPQGVPSVSACDHAPIKSGHSQTNNKSIKPIIEQ